MKNLLLTGKIQVGKSSLIKKAITNKNIKIGGYYTERITEDNNVSFIFRSYSNPNIKLPFAKINHNNKSKEVFHQVFKVQLVDLLENDLKSSDLIILDELGYMEENIRAFTKTIDKVLESKIKVLGVLKKYDSQFLNNIKNRSDTKVLQVNTNNRDFLVEYITDFIR